MLNEIKLMKSNRHYRIGDILLRQGLRWIEDREAILTQKKYRNSFLYKYLIELDDPLSDPFYDSKNTLPRGIEDIFWLLNLTQELKPNMESNNLFVHIRAGDIVLNEKNEISKFDSWGIQKRNWLYNKDELYKNIYNILRSNPSLDIQIISAFHFGDFYEKKRWSYSEEAYFENQILFLQLLNKILENYNLNIHPFKVNDIENIDDHFLLLCNADYAIIDNGSFGGVINLIRKMSSRNNIYLNLDHEEEEVEEVEDFQQVQVDANLNIEPIEIRDRNLQAQVNKAKREGEDLQSVLNMIEVNKLNEQIELSKKMGDLHTLEILEKKLEKLVQ